MKRQYVLPSCSLILEGMGTDPTQAMSILANAECQFMGIEQRLSGGLEFLQALVESVSSYAQSMLGNSPQPTSPEKLVRLVPAEKGAYHHLTVAARPEVDPALQEETSLTLSTVQLFDLTDALDQFLADTQTLPDMSVPVRSRPRSEVKSTEPMADRVIPPLIGVGALAAAAAGLFMLPIPEVPEFDPESLSLSTQPGLESPAAGLPGSDPGDGATRDEAAAADGLSEDGDDGADAASLNGPDEADGNDAQLLLSSEARQQIQDQLETQLVDALPSDVAFDSTLAYQVSVAENGDIVGYQAFNQVALDGVDSTPLPELTYVPVGDAEPDSTVRFRVQFEPDGTVTVVPFVGTVTDELESGVESEADEDDLSE